MREKVHSVLLVVWAFLIRAGSALLTPWRQLLGLSFATPLKKLHTGFYARAVHYYRTREVLRVFAASHRDELTKTPLNLWPQVQARQKQEVALIQAGQFDITDRKSWQWPWLPQNVNRFSMPVAKFLPYSLRRMSRTPIPRRAINLIKNAVTSQVWDIRVREHMDPIDDYQEQRIQIAKEMFSHPNNTDSFQAFLENGIEDLLVTGAFVAELRYTPDPERPIKLWTVNAESIRLFANWSEAMPDAPRYCQMTGLKGERGALLFYDDEVLFVKDNPSTDNPYGLGKMEVAFSAINALLGVHAMGSRAGSDQIHKTWLWWEQPQAAQQYDIIRRHIQNEMEGQARVSIIGGMKKPEVLEIQPMTEADLLLGWQEMLIRVIANAFDLSPLALGLERDVNRSTGETMSDMDFRNAVVPLATRLQEAFTRKIVHERLQWRDLEFVFPNLNQPSNDAKMDLNSRLYTTNAITPNQIRTSMGMQPDPNPFYDLNQFELQLLLAQAQSDLQDRNASRNSDRQTKAQNDMFDKQAALQKEQGAPQPGGEDDENQGGAPPTQQASVYRALVAGTNYTAQEICEMTIPTLMRLLADGSLPKPKTLLRNLKAQAASLAPQQQSAPPASSSGQPGVSFLEQMGQEVQAFLESLEQYQDAHPKATLNQALKSQWQLLQSQRLQNDQKRERDFDQWIYQNRGPAGSPGRLGRDAKQPAPNPQRNRRRA